MPSPRRTPGCMSVVLLQYIPAIASAATHRIAVGNRPNARFVARAARAMRCNIARDRRTYRRTSRCAGRGFFAPAAHRILRSLRRDHAHLSCHRSGLWRLRFSDVAAARGKPSAIGGGRRAARRSPRAGSQAPRSRASARAPEERSGCSRHASASGRGRRAAADHAPERRARRRRRRGRRRDHLRRRRGARSSRHRLPAPAVASVPPSSDRIEVTHRIPPMSARASHAKFRDVAPVANDAPRPTIAPPSSS